MAPDAMYTLTRNRTRVKRLDRRGDSEVVEVVFSDERIIQERGDDVAVRLIVWFNDKNYVDRVLVFVCEDVEQDDDFEETMERVRLTFGYDKEVGSDRLTLMVGKTEPDEAWRAL